jgi:hypothetical protein
MMHWGKGERSALSPRRVFHDQPSGGNTLTADHYRQMAEALGIRAQQVRAIAIIESAEKPFTKAGHPVVRFEAHHWRRHRIASTLGQSFDRAVNSADLDERWVQFLAMHRVDPLAAVKSHSFGWLQIMGFNHRLAGYETTEAFLDAMQTLDGQNKAFVNFVTHSPLLHTAFRQHNVREVARHYNGPRFADNRYDQKFAALSQRSLTA